MLSSLKYVVRFNKVILYSIKIGGKIIITIYCYEITIITV